MFRDRLSALGVALALTATGAAAHHSFSAEFEADTRGEISGTITRVWFSNPHVRYNLEVEREDGSTEQWELQTSSVTALRATGWSEDTVEVGDRVTAMGELGRRGAMKIFLRDLVTEDGVRMADFRSREVYTNPEELAKTRSYEDYGYGRLNEEAPFDISGPWNNRYQFRVTVDDLEPKPTPFTPEGRELFERLEHYDDDALRCMAPGLPRIFGSPYNMEVIDAGSHYVAIHVDHNMPRRIYMDGRSAGPDTPPSSLGFSVGRWEGDNTLVIETTHLLPAWLDGSGLPMAGQGTRLVERWEFTDDRLSMDRILTIYDPYYTAPLTRRRGSVRGDDTDVSEQGTCDPAGYYRDIYEAGQLEERLGVE